MGVGGEVGGWEVGGGGWEGGRWEGYGNGQVRLDRFDRRSDSMPVFAVGWLGMFRGNLTQVTMIWKPYHLVYTHLNEL